MGYVATATKAFLLVPMLNVLILQLFSLQVFVAGKKQKSNQILFLQEFSPNENHTKTVIFLTLFSQLLSHVLELMLRYGKKFSFDFNKMSLLRLHGNMFQCPLSVNFLKAEVTKMILALCNKCNTLFPFDTLP